MGAVPFKINRSSSKDREKDFYTENFSHYLQFACHYIPDEEISKDIVQDVFITYWKQQDNFHDEASVRSFFYKSIRNGCLNQIRHYKIRDQYFNTLPADWESDVFFMDNIIKEEVSDIILKEIEKLSETGRKTLLRSMEGFSNEEIAKEFTISVNTVKTHKARSYLTLRKNLEHLRMVLQIIFPS